MAKKKDQALDEEVKAITSKWKTTGDMRQTLAEQMQLLAEGKGSLELSNALNLEAAKVNKRMKEQIKEKEMALKEKKSKSE